jgi:beta-1,4-N-acetylglucosaminyltransferase
MKKQVLLVYGSGGHNEQMKRIYQGLSCLDEFDEFEFISLCDTDVKYPLTHICYQTETITDKFSYWKLIRTFPNKLVKLFKLLTVINKKHNIHVLISTGPGVAILSAFYFKLFKKVKIIHIESWSRFYSKSLTGRCLYKLSDVFYVQNQELISLYSKAKFRGRL